MSDLGEMPARAEGVAITDNVGTLISQQRYLPFGQVRSDIGSITQTDLGYTGQRQLDGGMGGLMDYHARFYDPYVNRFIQPDSLIPDQVNPQAWNRYSYANNSPIIYNDPTGHFFGIDDLVVVAVFVGVFFIFNGTSDSYQPNLSTEELQSREASVNLGTAITVTALSVESKVVAAAANLYNCATGNFCDPSSFTVPYSEASQAGETRTLYHGTDTAGANSILTNGIDLSKNRSNLDFNPSGQGGFYVTEDLAQAQDWALSKFGENARVLKITIPTEELESLNGKLFTKADDEWSNFVSSGRGGTLHHSYDYVEGPVLRKSTGEGWGNQLAIFTSEAVALFNKHIK